VAEGTSGAREYTRSEMSRYDAENLTSLREEPESALSQSPAQPTPASQPKAESNSLQSGLGNAMVAAAAAGESPPTNDNHFSLQSGYGNAAVERLLIQRKAEGETIPGIPATPTEEQTTPGVAASLTAGQSSTGAAAKPARALIVEDTAETLDPGQMRKSDFLTQLRTAVCNTAAEALADTPWSEAGCPYIDRWFGYYSAQSSQYIERATRKYAPEAAEATAAGGYIPPITARVRRSVTTWATTGEMTGAPEGVPMGLPGAGLTGAAGGAVSGIAGTASSQVPGAVGAPSAGGSVFYKERDGGARVADDPQAIQAQLGAGQSLDAGVKSRMESAFGESFSGVQVHTDANAAGISDNLNARAFTVGDQIAFGAGEYQPGTLISDALIAHELAHVVQQRGGGASVEFKQNGAAEIGALEDDADQAAVGAILSTWGGAGMGLANVARNAMPNLKSGLRLQRCGKSKREDEETEVRVISPQITEARATGRMMVTPENAASIGQRLARGEPGLDPAFVPKKGGTMFFVSEGDPYSGVTAAQSVSVDVSVKLPGDVIVFNDSTLLDIHAEKLAELFRKEGATLPKNFLSAIKDFLAKAPRRPSDFAYRAADLGISNTRLNDLLNPRRGLATSEAMMWDQVGSTVRESKGGVGRVVMSKDSHVSRGRPGEFLVVRDVAAVKIIGGGAQIADAMIAEGAKTGTTDSTIPEKVKAEVARMRRVGTVKAVFRVGGRILFVVAVAQDIFGIIYAKDKLKQIVKTAGGWAGGLAVGGAFAAWFAPGDAAGPAAWVAHGLGSIVAFGIGYWAGSEITTWVYEITIED